MALEHKFTSFLPSSANQVEDSMNVFYQHILAPELLASGF
jgi:hypothetical protein